MNEYSPSQSLLASYRVRFICAAPENVNLLFIHSDFRIFVFDPERKLTKKSIIFPTTILNRHFFLFFFSGLDTDVIDFSLVPVWFLLALNYLITIVKSQQKLSFCFSFNYYIILFSLFFCITWLEKPFIDIITLKPAQHAKGHSNYKQKRKIKLQNKFQIFCSFTFLWPFETLKNGTVSLRESNNVLKP